MIQFLKPLPALMATLALLCAGIAAAAPLDPLGDPATFKQAVEAINRKPLPEGETLARAVGAAVAIDARKRGRCTPAKIKLGALEPVTLDGMITAMIARGQVENAWLMSVRVEDCPPADPIRILLIRAADGQGLQAVFAGQGESLAWPSLSREALRGTVNAAVKKMRAAYPQCAPADMTPIGVSVTQRSPDLGPNVYGIRLKGTWSELWAFEPCGHRIMIPITFRTDGKGGAYWDIDEAQIVTAS